jgi:hypothetical protein
MSILIDGAAIAAKLRGEVATAAKLLNGRGIERGRT